MGQYFFTGMAVIILIIAVYLVVSYFRKSIPTVTGSCEDCGGCMKCIQEKEEDKKCY